MLHWTIANTSETKKKEERKKFSQIEDIKNWMKNTTAEIKVNITRNGSSWHYGPFDKTQWEEYRVTSVVYRISAQN